MTKEVAFRQQLDHPVLSRGGLTWTEKVAFLATALQQAEQTECPLEHVFEDKVYRRIIRIPAGVSLIGRPHLTGHMCRLLEGRCIWIRDGEQIELAAPFEYHTSRGEQLVIYTITDVVGETVHENFFDVKDPKILEPAIFESEASVLRRGREVAQRLLDARAAQESYAALLSTYGVEEQWANTLSKTTEDLIDYETDTEVGGSLIHGCGVFAKRNFAPQEVVGPASVAGFRTPLGRWTNHSGKPNVFPRVSADRVLWIAKGHISAEAEITVNYLESLAIARLVELKCLQLSQPPPS